MAAAELLRAASLLAILALAAFGYLSVPLLALLGFIGAAGTVAYSVAAPSLVPALVPQAALVRANGRIELARTAAFAAGPGPARAPVGRARGAPPLSLPPRPSLPPALAVLRVPGPPPTPPAPRPA